MVVLAMGAAAVPDPESEAGIIAYLVPVTLSCALLVVATSRIPRPERGPWCVVTAGCLIFLLGEYISAPYELTASETWPTPAEAFFTSGLLVLLVGVLKVNSRRSPVTYRGDVLDSVIVAVSAGVLSVVFFVLPVVGDRSLSLLAKVVSSAYPITDVFVIYLVVRMIIVPAGRAPMHWLLLAAQSCTLVADIGWNIIQLTIGGDSYPRWINALWQGWYLLVALGAACAARTTDATSDTCPIPTTRPSIVRETSPSGGVLSAIRLVALTVASLLPTAILVTLNAVGRLEHPGWLGAGALLLGALVAARIWDLLQQLRAQTAQVAQLARIDPLTGLPNRRSWDEELDRVRRSGTQDSAFRLVALLDLDHFKRFNDRHGHRAGDELLQAAADAWKQTLGQDGFLARWGGEEFAVLLVDHRQDRALALLERLRCAVPNEQTCSVGVAIWDGVLDPVDLLGLADRALYIAKSGGRDRLVLAPVGDHASVEGTSTPGAVIPGAAATPTDTGAGGSPSRRSSGGIPPPR